LPHVVLPRPPEWLIEFPLPQIPGLAANDIRTVPLLTRPTWLAMLCAGATTAAAARAARTATADPASDVIRSPFIG
jgi:hypothetical protein